MAAELTAAEDSGPNGVNRIVFTWQSDASGDVSGSTSGTYTGEVRRVVTNPDDSAAPSDNYDITLTSADGSDLLNGNGANRDTADTESISPSSIVFGSAMTLTVANAGDTKAGTVTVYVTDNVS